MKLEAGVHVTPNVKLLRPLGEGGMGEVWVAEHLSLGTEVAVKFLLGDFASNQAARARFSQEAAAASRVKSTHVVKIYDHGLTESNVPFIVMELLEGTDLSKRIAAETKLMPSEMVTIIAQLCKALQRAHDQQVVHRDVKPENVFLASEGGDLFVKLLDFGVAKTAARGSANAAPLRRSTLAGESLGTPYYMSPEQFRSSKTIDHRSDLWSVGVLTYEALTGSLPFVEETVGALAIVVDKAEAIPPSQVNPSLPSSFDTWFAKACARDPDARFQSARELADALALTFGTLPTMPREIVVSLIDPSELTPPPPERALSETAFSTAGGAATTSTKSSVRIYLIAAAAVSGAIAIGIFAFHHTSETASDTHPAATPTTTTSSQITADPAPPPTHIVPLDAVLPTTTVTASVARETTTVSKPISKPVPAASSSAKGKHDRDIW